MISKYRLFIVIFIPAALALAAGMLFVQQKNSEISEAQFESQLKSQWRLAALVAEAPDMQPALLRLYEQYGLRVTLIDQAGEATYDSAISEPLESHKDREEVKNARAGSPSMAVRQSASSGIYTIYYADKLPDGRVLRVAYPASFYTDQKNSLMDQAVTGILVLVALVALFAFIMSKRESDMLRSLSLAVKEAQDGGRDLPGFDNADLDEALFALSSANRELKSLNEEKFALSQRLEYILANINEGVLLLVDDEIIYHNRRAEEILQFKIPQKLLDINNQEMISVFASLSGGQEGPLQLGDKSIIISQALSGGVSRLILLHDVSDQEKYSGYKSDLIGNISHELKTPLALIMGAAEVIIKDPDMPRSYLEKFLGTIHKNSGRINLLLDDLIFLHRLESTRENNVQECDLGEMIEELGGLLGQLEKKVHYDFEDATVRINSTHLISVLSNLIINANKYSQGDAIEASIKKSGPLLEIRVSDQGPLIPQSERDRIFERFYTISKSRNRGAAGSGLGLSIVKHIARVYKGEAAVEPNNNGGNTFVVRLLEK